MGEEVGRRNGNRSWTDRKLERDPRRLGRRCLVCRLGAVAAIDLLTLRRQKLASLFPIEQGRCRLSIAPAPVTVFDGARHHPLERHLVRPLSRTALLAGALHNYCSLAYSALACLKMGMSGSASFQRAKKRSLRQAHALEQVEVARVGAHSIPEPV